MEVTEEQKKKIQDFVKQGRFNSEEDFLQQAVKLLLYAEDKKDEFLKAIKK